MTERGHTSAALPALKRRREEVVARLAAYGLARGPHRVVRAGRADAAGGAGLCRRLRLALEELGTVFSSFGLYLSTRVDLLDAHDCLELSAIPDRAPALDAAAVRELFRREVGLDACDAFLAFDDAPFESRLLRQSHRARMRDGAPVVVRLVRPEAESQFLRDVDLLGLLEGALAGAGLAASNFKGAVADFTSELRLGLDLAQEAEALALMARDAEGFEMLRVPSVASGLCAVRVLTVEELPGVRADELVARDAAGARRGLPHAFDRAGAARLLCSVWLRQALLGQAFPASPRAGDIVFVSDRQVAFNGGPFVSMHAAAQKNLWNYLLTSAAENPDRACSCLTAELKAEGGRGADEDLRHRFRQVVPFRDSGWHDDADDTNLLAEHLIVHWRSAAECGYVPLPHLPSFYRGLFAVSDAARRLSPEGDPLLEGLQDARLQESFSHVREMLSLNRLGDQADRYAAMMMGLPGRIDEMLTLGSEGGPRLKLHAPEAPSGRREKNSSAAVTALILLLAGAVVLLPRLTASLAGEAWANRINALVFILLGAMLLRAAGRTV